MQSSAIKDEWNVSRSQMMHKILRSNYRRADVSLAVSDTRVTRVAGVKRRRFRDPEPYEGKSLNEAQIFLLCLRTIFSIDPFTY
jgi:hypothetical protein